MDSFWSLVEQAAAGRPGDVLLADDAGRELTTRAFREEAERAAAGLLSWGIRPGDVVSWQLPTTLEAAVLMAACARAGVGQNPIIPVLREHEVGLICREVRPRLLVVPETWRGFAHADMGRSLGIPVAALDLESPPTAAIRLPQGDPAMLPAPAASTDCRWIYYSSGTTAAPKGARHTDASVIAGSNGTVDQFGLGAGDVYPIGWPFAHIGGVSMLVSFLRAGGKLVMFDFFDPRATPQRMAAHQPTILGSATPFFKAYLAAQREHGTEPLYPALRACVAGGAPTVPEVAREVSETFGVSGIPSSWGLTEFPVATSETLTVSEPGTTVGWPAKEVSVRVVDGELRLKGPQCFLGYVNAALNAAAFDGEGWFRTGDLGSIGPDGRVRIDGRLKDVIIRNAENISALEVENALSSHPTVADIAVIGLPDPRTGERLCAVVVPEAGTQPTLAELTAHCQAAGLARYKHPELLRLTAALPRTPMGKVRKNQLIADAAGERGGPGGQPSPAQEPFRDGSEGRHPMG